MQSIALECDVSGPYPYRAYKVCALEPVQYGTIVKARSLAGAAALTQNISSAECYYKVGDFVTPSWTKVPAADLAKLVWVSSVDTVVNADNKVVARICRAFIPSTMGEIEGVFSPGFGANVKPNDLIPQAWVTWNHDLPQDWFAMVYLPSLHGEKTEFGFIGLTAQQLWSALNTAIGFKGPKHKPIRADIKCGAKRWVFMGSPQYVRHELEVLLTL